MVIERGELIVSVISSLFGTTISCFSCLFIFVIIFLYFLLYHRAVKYHEPEFWKFGEEGNKYFRHATGQIYAVSKDLATYIAVNQ